MRNAKFLFGHAGLQPDHETLSSMMSTYGTLAVHGFEGALHTSVIKLGYESDAMVTSSLILIYSKIRAMNDGFFVFGKMVNMDTITWDAITVAQAYHGSAIDSLKLFHRMTQYGCRLNNAVFLVFWLCVLIQVWLMRA